MSESDESAGIVKDANVKDANQKAFLQALESDKEFNLRVFFRDLVLLKYLYGVLDGATLGASSLFKLSSYWVASIPSEAKDIRSDVLSDPTGIALVCIDTLIITSISVLANTASKNNDGPETHIAKRYYHHTQNFLAIVWPYLRISIKALKNNQKAAINISKILSQTGAVSSSLANGLALPLGITLGLVGMVNSICYQHYNDKRKDRLKQNAALLETINQEKLSLLNADQQIASDSFASHAAGGAMSMIQGFTDGLYYQLGMLMFASFVPGGLVAMTAIISVVVAIGIVSSIYQEYEKQRELTLSAMECKLALQKNSLAAVDNEIEHWRAKKSQQIAELIAKKERLKAAIENKLDAKNNLPRSSMLFEGKDVTLLTGYLYDKQELVSLDNEIKALRQKQQALVTADQAGLKKLLDAEGMGELLSKQAKAKADLDKQQKKVDEYKRPSKILAGLSVISGGMAGFATLGALLYCTSAVLGLLSIPFSPWIVVGAVAVGLSFIAAYAGYKLWHTSRARNEYQKELDTRDAAENLTEESADSGVEEEEKSWAETVGDLMYKADQFLFDVFTVCQGAFAGVGKGDNLTEIGKTIFNTDDSSSTIVTVGVGIVTAACCLLYAACLGLRNLGKTAPKDQKKAVDSPVVTDSGEKLSTGDESKTDQIAGSPLNQESDKVLSDDRQADKHGDNDLRLRRPAEVKTPLKSKSKKDSRLTAKSNFARSRHYSFHAVSNYNSSPVYVEQAVAGSGIDAVMV